MRFKQILLCAVFCTGLWLSAPAARQDTAVVHSYAGVPVFYHCRPLHACTTVCTLYRTSLISYSSDAFKHYAHAARRSVKGRIGIMIDDLNFGTDSFRVVLFDECDAAIDTAVFSNPIFLGAKPVRPYKVIEVLNDEMATGPLYSNLQRYLSEAGCTRKNCDGIMVRDVHYVFGKDEIHVFRWKKKGKDY